MKNRFGTELPESDPGKKPEFPSLGGQSPSSENSEKNRAKPNTELPPSRQSSSLSVVSAHRQDELLLYRHTAVQHLESPKWDILTCPVRVGNNFGLKVFGPRT
ncbi:hypothetical protein ILYODFUR_017073 [Ilyodon furcidens]|uniref:Uncharacterized protein n=1 Tax=Ilyodon furcidens TaxID=33524 RepID=A0ABV0U8T7_9TELE